MNGKLAVTCILAGFLVVVPVVMGSWVTDLDPFLNMHDAAIDTNISAVFNAAVDQGSVGYYTFHVNPMSQAPGNGVFTFPDATTAMFNPDGNYFYGEEVEVSITGGLIAGGEPVNPVVWRFRTGVLLGSGHFIDSGQVLVSPDVNDSDFGDLDGDGDLDVIHACQIYGGGAQPNPVWLNDGSGVFTDSGHALGNASSSGVLLGDLDYDGDLDVFVVNVGEGMAGEPNRVYLNDGAGIFTSSGQDLGFAISTSGCIGDVDGDGDLDVYVTNYGTTPNLYLNNGSAQFTVVPQTVSSSMEWECEFGDLDSDGDLDLFVAGFMDTPDLTFFNNGAGIFTPGQTLGLFSSADVCLGDMDGDGDLDAFTSSMVMMSSQQSSILWINDGTGVFTNSGQSLVNDMVYASSLGDVDADGDLDVFIGQVSSMGPLIYLNDGAGTLTDSGETFTMTHLYDVDLADLDNDGDLDGYLSSSGSMPDLIYFNAGPYPIPTTTPLGLGLLLLGVSGVLVRKRGKWGK